MTRAIFFGIFGQQTAGHSEASNCKDGEMGGFDFFRKS